jgi:hypothetical protein
MSRCLAKTRAGRRCLHHASDGSEFCSAHRSNVSSREALATGAGAIVGNAVAPGIGGLLLGGLTGYLGRNLFKGNSEAKKRVFVSFDFDHDRALKDFILGQAKHPDSPFDVSDHSLKEAAPERGWQSKARAAIARSEIVLVLVGRETYRAHGVLKEVAMARALGVKIVQIIGYSDRNVTAVAGAGRMYAWSWKNLKKLLS